MLLVNPRDRWMMMPMDPWDRWMKMMMNPWDRYLIAQLLKAHSLCNSSFDLLLYRLLSTKALVAFLVTFTCYSYFRYSLTSRPNSSFSK